MRPADDGYCRFRPGRYARHAYRTAGSAGRVHWFAVALLFLDLDLGLARTRSTKHRCRGRTRQLSHGMWGRWHLATFFKDIQAHREEGLAGCGIKPIFPLWKLPTDVPVQERIAAGLKTRVMCSDPRKLPAKLAGRDVNEQFLRDLPARVDPCGRDGEFYTCVYDEPMFRWPIGIEGGEVLIRLRPSANQSGKASSRELNTSYSATSSLHLEGCTEQDEIRKNVRISSCQS